MESRNEGCERRQHSTFRVQLVRTTSSNATLASDVSANRTGWQSKIFGTPTRQAALVSLVVAVVVLYFFCPKFVLWRGINLPDLPGMGPPPGALTAEVRRARSSLRQIERPFAAVDDPIGRPIAWRLLFPLIWHYAGLPDGLYLAMPFIGCLLTLGIVSRLMLQRTGNLLWAALTTLAFAASPWFFVSTGWLAYFDSWMMLGLVIASFGRSQWVLAVCCLLVPWIDERFLLGLPICLIVRSLDQGAPGGRSRKELLQTIAIALACGAVYLILRLLLLQTGTGEADAYAEEHFSWGRLAAYSPLRCLEGPWMTLRAGWLLVAMFFWTLWRRGNGWQAGLLLATLWATIGVGLVIASDIHRTLCVGATLLIAGALAAARENAVWLQRALPWMAAANLLLPGAHVFTTEREPIFYLYVEIDRWRHPPAEVDPQTFVGWGVGFADQQKLAEAESCFLAALALDPRCCPARVQRATLYLNAGNLQAAAEDLANALTDCPADPDAYYLRGIVRLRAKELSAGKADLEQAMRLAPASWPYAEAVREMLKKLHKPAAE